MSFYSNLAATAAQLLAKFGQPVTLRSVGAGAYDPATSGVLLGAALPTDVVRKGVLLDFARGTTTVRGNLVQAIDKQLLLESGVVPSLEDLVLVGGATFTIVSIGEVNPAGTPVLYDLHLRS